MSISEGEHPAHVDDSALEEAPDTEHADNRIDAGGAGDAREATNPVGNGHRASANGADTPAVISAALQQAYTLAADSRPDRLFSGPALITYINERMPAGYEPITMPKLIYLRQSKILKPRVVGAGSDRKSWRYTLDDASLAIAAELLKKDYGYGIKEIKAWIESSKMGAGQPAFAIEGSEASRSSLNGALDVSAPRLHVYRLLRNRVLGSIMAALGGGTLAYPPPECIIALRRATGIVRPDKLSWGVAQDLLASPAWHIAVTDPTHNLNMYPNLSYLIKYWPGGYVEGSDYLWRYISLHDSHSRITYEAVIGLPPENKTQEPTRTIVRAIEDQIDKYIDSRNHFNLRELPGLATLLKAAFADEMIKLGGTKLDILAGIIASSVSWLSEREYYYCSILVTEFDDEENKLRHVVQGNSLAPPYKSPHPKGRSVAGDRLLAGWVYRYAQQLYINDIDENDPRISYPLAEQKAVIATPAMAVEGDEERPFGIVFSSWKERFKEEEEKDLADSRGELMASLRLFGYVCGDIIARDRIEVETTHKISGYRQYVDQQVELNPDSPKDREDLLSKVAELVKPPDSTQGSSAVHPNSHPDPYSRIFFLTLNIEVPIELSPRRERVATWLCERATQVVHNYLSEKLVHSLESPLQRTRLKVTHYDYDEGKRQPGQPHRFVFAVLDAVYLSEDECIQRVRQLRDEELPRLAIPRVPLKFYPWAVTLAVEDLYTEYEKHGEGELIQYLETFVDGALRAGPYLIKALYARQEHNLDEAAALLKNALDRMPDDVSWYAYKQLAKAKALQGRFKEAVNYCKNAVKQEPRYASAYALLADCHAYLGEFPEAVRNYEAAVRFSRSEASRRKYLNRYGHTLAGLGEDDLKAVLAALETREDWEEMEGREYLLQKILDTSDSQDVGPVVSLSCAMFEQARSIGEHEAELKAQRFQRDNIAGFSPSSSNGKWNGASMPRHPSSDNYLVEFRAHKGYAYLQEAIRLSTALGRALAKNNRGAGSGGSSDNVNDKDAIGTDSPDAGAKVSRIRKKLEDNLTQAIENFSDARRRAENPEVARLYMVATNLKYASGFGRASTATSSTPSNSSSAS